MSGFSLGLFCREILRQCPSLARSRAAGDGTRDCQIQVWFFTALCAHKFPVLVTGDVRFSAEMMRKYCVLCNETHDVPVS